MDIIRDHDYFYLNEKRKNTPKEAFKFIERHCREYLNGMKQSFEILDIGCATGDFLWYMRSVYPFARLTGMDVLPELLERAKTEVDGAEFIQGDIQTGRGLPDKQFDTVFCIGVVSIFDSYIDWMTNILSLVKKGGRAYIMSLFNPEDLDVLVKVRRSCEEGPWQAGWNVWSKKTIASYLDRLNLKFDFYDFDIGLDLPRSGDDPLRSWTFKDENGKRIILNGIQLIHTGALLEIKK